MDIKRVDLIQQLVDRHGYTKKAATSIVDDFTNLILENLEEGNTISIHNFGTQGAKLSEPTDRGEGRCPCALDSPLLPWQQNAYGR